MKEERQSEIERISNDITTTIVDHVMNHGMTQRDDMTSAEVFFLSLYWGEGVLLLQEDYDVLPFGSKDFLFV